MHLGLEQQAQLRYCLTVPHFSCQEPVLDYVLIVNHGHVDGARRNFLAEVERGDWVRAGWVGRP